MDTYPGLSFGTIVVPEGVTQATFAAQASGGNGAPGVGGSHSGGGGGGGAKATATVSVTPGEMLTYYANGDVYVSRMSGGGYLVFARAGAGPSGMSGGIGGSASECIGDTIEPGANGSDGQPVVSPGTDELGALLPAPLVDGGNGGSFGGGKGGLADGGMGFAGAPGLDGWLAVEFS